MKKNNYTIWGQTNNIYNLCKSCTLLSSFVVWVCVFALMLFPVFGLGLSFFAMCFLCIGFKKNVLDCLQKKPIKVESIFNYFKYSISAFCLKVCSLVLIILWSLLLIVPGIIACLNYSFAPYIFINDPKIGTIECLERSKKLTYGYRSDIFLVYLFAILFLILIAVLSFSLVLIFNFMVKMPLWFNILVPIIITMFVNFVLVLPYVEMFIGNIYLNVQEINKKQTKQKSNKNVSIEQ